MSSADRQRLMEQRKDEFERWMTYREQSYWRLIHVNSYAGLRSVQREVNAMAAKIFAPLHPPFFYVDWHNREARSGLMIYPVQPCDELSANYIRGIAAMAERRKNSGK